MIATGGLAHVIVPFCETIDEVDDLLTLTGPAADLGAMNVSDAQPLAHRPRFTIADVELPNRVLLAPLAGIGNWFVRLQAHRHGAGLAVSEMVSSFAIAHRNRRTVEEMLRIHPDEGPVSIQLFGADPDVMREAAAVAAAAGPALIDLNMGCPVPKVLKTGRRRGADRRPATWRSPLRGPRREGSGLPVTVKVRSGIEPGDRSGFELARRLVADAGRRRDRPAPAPGEAVPPRRAPTTRSSASSARRSSATAAASR